MPRRSTAKLGNEVGQSGAAFVRPSALTEPPVADQSDGAGVGVGVGVTVADGSGEGDSARRREISAEGSGRRDELARINSARRRRRGSSGASVCSGVHVRRRIRASLGICPACVVPVELPLEPLSPAAAPVIPTAWLLNPVCAPAFVPMCAPTFVFARYCTPGLVPVCGATCEVPLKPLCPVGAVVGAPGGLLPLVPIRGVCARLNGTVATHIAITPSLIECNLSHIIFPPSVSPFVWATYLSFPEIFCSSRSGAIAHAEDFSVPRSR